ncbi:MAG: TonB-dependent receptor [Acidobacteria bacterium]|nr:TonB-dependent receptor [Acidobacteriota bacterium]
MYSADKTRLTAVLIACTLLVFIAAIPTLQAQTKQFLTWQDDLYYLQTVADADLAVHQDGIEQIRKGVELYIEMHPSTEVSISPATAKPWEPAQIRDEIDALQQAIDAILKEDPNRPFNLGTTEISVTSEASPLSPMADTMESTEIQKLQLETVGDALDFLPGLSLDRSSQRNEAGLRLRGFSNRGQVSFYLDGIPIQVPYDGSLDFKRFLTNDVAEIQIAKGYSSPLMGANNLGGSVNIVTRQPEKPFELDVLTGAGSGEMFKSYVQLGSQLDQFYFQGSIDWLQREYFPLSGDFPLQTPEEPSPEFQTTYKRNQADSRDARYSGRIAWTPKDRDQYVFSYTNQKAEKGNPLYAGPNTNAFNRYWRWPYWNKTGYYFLSNTGIGESSSVKFRVFVDQFDNGLGNYDDYTYTSLSGRRAWFSVYDDHTYGASTEFNTRILPKNSISGSFYYKDDTHRSYNTYPRTEFTEPPQLYRNQTYSIGFQDVFTVTSRLRATFGFSADHLKGLQAQQLDDDDALTPLTCFSDPDNSSFSGCTPHIWTYNPQASIAYSFTDRDTLFVTFSDRGRFPLLMESYSYRLGRGVPNPDLKAEHSRNWTVGYSYAFASRTVAQIEYFRSDLRDSIHSIYVDDTEGLCDNTGQLAGYCSMNVNVAEEVHEGFEISVRSTPFTQLTLDASYSYLNRDLTYKFADIAEQDVNEEIDILPSLPRNKVVLNATIQLPHSMLAMFTFRHEGGLNLQDTTWDDWEVLAEEYTFEEYQQLVNPFGASHSIVDLGLTSPSIEGFSWQVGVKNLFDTNYYYSAGYPEAGRNWYFNTRYKF